MATGDRPPFVGRAALLVSAAAVTAGAATVAAACAAGTWLLHKARPGACPRWLR